MIRWFINRRLNAAEKDLGAPLDYLRHIASVSLGAFFKFTRLMPLAEYRRSLPPGPYHVARIVATRDEDCGVCVQIEVNLAKKAGVSANVLKTVLAANPDALPEDLAEAYRFAEAVVAADGTEEQLRERIRQRYGEAGLIELAMAISICRVFPTTKRALGYAKSCQEIPANV